TIYDMICSISVGENDEEQDFDIDPEALTALFGGMGEDDEVMSEEVMGEEVMDEEDAAASRHCEEERRSNPEEEIEENTDEKFEEENIEEEVSETDEIQEPEEERRFDSDQRPIEEDVEEERRFDYAQQHEEEEEVQQSEEEEEPIAEEEKHQEGDEFGLFFRFEDIPLREGEVRFDSAQRPEEEEDQQFEEEITNDEKRFDSAQQPEEEIADDGRFDSAQQSEEEEVIEEEQHLEYERTPDMVWDFGPSGEVESEEVESEEVESGELESGKVESGEVKSEVVEEIDGKTVHFIEEVSIDEIPEKDRVEGDNLITDNPFEMPAMEDGSPSYGSFFEKDDMGFEISSNETLGESMIDDDNSLNAKYQHAPVNDLKTAIGLNDKFLLVNELFGGSMEKYNKSIDNLNDLKTLNGAMIYLNELKVELQWNSNNEAYKKLWTLVAQKFEGQ
ncbi:MAG: hypothetical protein MJZ94_11735, partial [Bacteroidales bacterium]|nr:hypothetical protein [Bacteroidales bacterium]